MKVVIGSKNPPKADAVKAAFSKFFPDEAIDYELVAASSNVSDHPVDALESMTGAKNRAQHARELEPEADYYVGIEGGLLTVGEDSWEVGWVAIMNNEGEIHTATSSGIEMKGKLLEAIKNGQELSHAMEKHHGMKDLGKANGFYGLTTDDHVTRTTGYIDAIIFALAPFKYPQYFR